MIWIRCFMGWATTDGVFDESRSGELVLANLEQVASIRQISDGVSQVMLAGASCNLYYVAGDPNEVLARVYKNGTATCPLVAV